MAFSIWYHLQKNEQNCYPPSFQPVESDFLHIDDAPKLEILSEIKPSLPAV